MLFKKLITRIVLAHITNYYSSIRRLSDIKYIVLHFTANDGDSDEGNANYFKTGGRKASAHFFVDDDSITQSVDILNIAWSVGGNLFSDYKTTGGATLNGICTNSNSVSIEMCDTVKNGVYDLSNATRKRTIELVRALMTDLNIDINHVVRHFDVTGKYCPRYFCKPYGSDAEWEKFKAEIVGGTVEVKPAEITKVEVTTPISVVNYQVRVTDPSLNYRQGPSVTYAINGTITDKGVYTIIAESNGWGKLKSGAGWINLHYTEKVVVTNSTPVATPVTPTLNNNAQEIVNKIMKGVYGNGWANRKAKALADGYSESAFNEAKTIINGGKTTTTATAKPSVSYYPACASKYTSIVDALASIGVSGSYSNRSAIASKNGISGYKGTAQQNEQLLKLLKNGALVK